MSVKYGSLSLILKTLKCKLLGIADAQRWGDLQNFEVDWDQRTKMIADLIPARSRVLEFGAGRMRLQTYLDPSCEYLPCDLINRGEGTIVFDLNKKPLPDLTALQADIAVFAGVLEYIQDLPSLTKWLSNVTPVCITSYECCYTSVRTFPRLCETFRRIRTGWVNSYSETELEELFSKANFSCSQKVTWETPGGDERIFLFQRLN